jgi:protein-S-isoprenylcysteine O-methyltransferase Ste14
MLPFLRAVAWLACVVYSTIPAFWLVIHPYVGYWRSRRRNPYKVLLPLWTAMWVAMGAVTWPWHQVTLYTQPWTWAAALVFFAGGLSIYIQSVRGFSSGQLGGVPELLGGHPQRLVKLGIRSRVRHPVYLGHLCEMLAWSVGSGLLVNFLLTAFAFITGAIMIRMEDKELEERFGGDYRSYKNSVPAVFPRL